jgi:hypothetical protein
MEGRMDVQLIPEIRNVSVLYKDPGRTSQYTLSTPVIKTNLLIMCKINVTVCFEIHTKQMNAM